MAGLALLTLLPFVLIVFLMARVTVHFQLVSVQIPLVATDALCIQVLSKQWKFGFPIMIEQNLFPFLIGMAAFTLGTKTAFVFVVRFMAGITIHFQLIFVQVPLVTAGAFSVAMLAGQRKFGFFAMIKKDFFPSALDMAAFAFRAKTAFMLVILLVAGRTIRLQFFLVQIAFVTSCAFHIDMLAQQRVFG